MNHEMLLQMKRTAFPKLNERPYTFEDVQRLAKRERIHLKICDYDPDILGYYNTKRIGNTKRKQKFIILNTSLDEIGRNFVGLHELTHHFRHVPLNHRDWYYCRRNAERTKSKHECEADNIALIAMIPLPLLKELAFTGYEDLHPALAELCLRRWKIWKRHGI